MKIIIDLDNTICRTNEYFLYNCKIRFGKNDLEYSEDLPSYHLTEWFVKNKFATKVEAIAMKEIIFNDENYWATIPLMDDARQIIFDLNLKHKIFIASDAITTNNDACMTGKKKWMKRFLPFIELSQLIFIQNKSMLKGDLLIEDVAEQVVGFNGWTMLFDYPYNKHYEPTYRVYNWKEAETIINKIGA